MATQADDRTAETLGNSCTTFERMTPTIGAEVSGVDLGAPLDDATIAEIERAVVEYKVLVFRGQNSLDNEKYIRFGRRFGDLEVEPWRDTVDDLPIFIASGYGSERWIETWHVDMPFQERPPAYCILRAINVPEVGRDTLWADMEAVYDDLSDTMKDMIKDLNGYHCNKSVHGAAAGRQRPHPAEKDSRLLEAEHPLVRTNPISGRKCIYASKTFTKAIVGMTQRESDALLEFLFAQVRDPEYQLRVRWSPDTVIMWDNRSSQHRLIVDRDPNEGRVLHRLSIVGEVPF